MCSDTSTPIPIYLTLSHLHTLTPSHPHSHTHTFPPSQSNHDHLFLQGSDRLYLNSSKSVVSSGNHGNHGNQERGVATDNVSSPQWKVVQLPSSYLVMNWPVKVCGRILQCDWSMSQPCTKYMYQYFKNLQNAFPAAIIVVTFSDMTLAHMTIT